MRTSYVARSMSLPVALPRKPLGNAQNITPRHLEATLQKGSQKIPP
jgi:hypothetical protein